MLYARGLSVKKSSWTANAAQNTRICVRILKCAGVCGSKLQNRRGPIEGLCFPSVLGDSKCR